MNETVIPFDPTKLARVWRRVRQDAAETIAKVRGELTCNFPPPADGYEEDENFVYLPVTTLVRHGDEVRQTTITFAIGEGVLVTLEPPGGYAVFDRAMQQLRRRPEMAASAHGVMLVLLQAMNSTANQMIELASAALEAMNDQIDLIIRGVVTERRRELGVSDIGETMAALNDKEELVSRIQEGQLLLQRAARYLRLEIDATNTDLRSAVEGFISDAQGVKEHAGFEHDKLRYLQNSVMTTLNVKQNQIVKVFTIITAVFLPPTLVGTFYGMNFAVMPELSWEHGFVVTIMLTLASALLPLLYIRQKGWLR